MKILVTGATGFLGASLCASLESIGYDVMRANSKNCDLTRETSLRQFDRESFDQIYHLAAWTQAGDFCLHHAGEQWLINQQINTNMLGWWKERQPQAKLICMGTSCAYPTDRPMLEENYLEGTPIESLFTYAMTKRMLLVGLRSLQQQYGMRYFHAVPSTLYGPGYHTDGRQMHFIFDLIRKILRGRLYGEPVTLWGDGHQKRELVFLDDFVRVLLRLAASCDNAVINVGSGEEYTIRQFAQLICEKVGYDAGKIQFDLSKYVGAKSKCLDVNKLRRLAPDATWTPLEVGLQRTIDWFLSNRETVLSR